jgi:hypothetical protein
MFNFKSFSKSSVTQAMSVVIACTALGLTSCSTGESGNKTSATPQGTIDIKAVKLGVPEATLKDAMLTFQPDPKGSIGPQTQYLSRTNNENGAQYIAKCRDGKIVEIDLLYKEKVSKDAAKQDLMVLMPADAPAQSKVDDKQLKDGKTASPIEIIYFGDAHQGQVVYADKTASQVMMVLATFDPTKVASTSGAATTTDATTAPAADAPKTETPAPSANKEAAASSDKS